MKQLSSRLPLNAYVCSTCRLQLKKMNPKRIRIAQLLMLKFLHLEQLDDDVADCINDPSSLNFADTAESDNDYDSGIGDQETTAFLSCFCVTIDVLNWRNF